MIQMFPLHLVESMKETSQRKTTWGYHQDLKLDQELKKRIDNEGIMEQSECIIIMMYVPAK